MTKESLVLLLGIVVFFIPRSGIPEEWQKYILYGAGFLLVVVGYLLRHKAYLRRIERANGERATDSFVESSVERFDADTTEDTKKVEM